MTLVDVSVIDQQVLLTFRQTAEISTIPTRHYKKQSHVFGRDPLKDAALEKNINRAKLAAKYLFPNGAMTFSDATFVRTAFQRQVDQLSQQP